ncbi:hypothetical protein [Klebsiella pneumoniae]|uniref:hypothetical protein n=1 Tax=Klebsiella pneumoniae TaxID=573 RepID=UPI001C72A10E|nr:hypothetical protein [Klebsiella pneumoniae]MCN9157157.1 hypothetical protein [Klebsiella pneumoniae]MCN9201571.1 hypothetical protein [Klebsiella pneumoniae]MCN9685309.1 hypothetical protein [Klebsiella pneumoniae]MCN9712624.1 hypothetical protein [Klebsiella pneumoniae]MCO0703701.1 hypothetical protein [Klebsiella pneumoniae]
MNKTKGCLIANFATVPSPEVRGEDEHTRHGGTTWRHLSAGGFIAGMVKAA